MNHSPEAARTGGFFVLYIRGVKRYTWHMKPSTRCAERPKDA